MMARRDRKTLASGSQVDEQSQKKTSSSRVTDVVTPRKGKRVNGHSDDSSRRGGGLALQEAGAHEAEGAAPKKRKGKGKKRLDLSSSRSDVVLKSEISLPGRDERASRSADADPDEKSGTTVKRKSKRRSRRARSVDETNASDASNKLGGTVKRKRKCSLDAGGEGIDGSSRATDGEEGIVEESSRERDDHTLREVSHHTGEGEALKKNKKRKRKRKRYKSHPCGPNHALSDDSGPSPKIRAPRSTDADPGVEIDKVSDMNSSPQVRKEVQRSKRVRHNAGSVDQADASVTEERKWFSSPVADLVATGGKGLDSSPRATDATVTENSEAMDHTGDRAVSKERKRMEKYKACLDGPKNALLNKSGLDLKSGSSLPGKDDFVSRSEHAGPHDKPHISANIKSLSPEVSKGQTRIKSSRKKREKEPASVYVRERSSKPTLVENINEEPTENTSSLVSKEDVGLSTDASNSSMHSHPGSAIDSSSHDKKKVSSKRNHKDIDKGRGNSLGFSSNRDSKDIQERKDVSSDSKKDNDTTNSGSSALSSREDGFIGTVGIDAGKKADSLPVVNSNSGGVVDTASEGSRKQRKKNKKSAVNPEPCALLDVSSTSSSLMPDTIEIVKQETDKTSKCFICPSPIRGVVDNFPSTDMVNKPDSCLHSFKKEDGSFSFQVTDHNKSSVIFPENTCQLGNEIKYDNGPSTGHTENALDSMPTCIHNKMNNGQREKDVASSSVSGFAVISLVAKEVEDNKLKAAPMLQERTLVTCTGKKLLVLDLNGLLADIVQDYRNVHNAYKVAGKAVFKRPFCDDFLKFCFERFDIGVWSSRRGYNVTNVVDYLMGNAKHKLRFCWDQSRCTITGFNTIDNAHKPLVLKELKKLWNKEDSDLPWEKGEYSPTNTLLVDDSPYKALCNPPHTAIFPWPYSVDDKNDCSLGPEGDLRVYLEGLAIADNVQEYVQEHPFGQPAITATDPSWKFYLRIINRVESNSVSRL